VLSRTMKRLANNERGFTLIEILVVILVIGILAALALPNFLGEGKKAYDAEAKANARNLVTFVDSCYTKDDDYSKCATQAETESESLDWGTNPGQVSVVNSSNDSYEIKAVSRGQTNGDNNVFTVKRTVGTPVERTCTGAGGCTNGSW
jgi:type IV pilus assembly protein PilA